MTAVGMLMVVIGTWGFTQFTMSTSGTDVQLWLAFRGLGLGLTNIPLQTLALSVVSNKAMARASSLVSVTRQVFSAVGVSALFSYLSQQTVSHVPTVTAAFTGAPLKQAKLTCFAQIGPNVPVLRHCVQQIASKYIGPHAFVLGLNDTFTAVLIGCAICVPLALLVGRDPAVEAFHRAQANGEHVPASPMTITE